MTVYFGPCKNKSVLTRNLRKENRRTVFTKKKSIQQELNHKGLHIICLTAQEVLLVSVVLKVPIGPVEACAFISGTTEKRNTSECPNYTYRLNPHSDTQPMLSP